MSRARARPKPPPHDARRNPARHGTPAPDPTTQAILQRWREAVPNDRLAHLVRDAARGLTRGLQLRLAEHDVTFGQWAYLRILWERDGITQRDLSVQAGLMEPTTHAAVGRLEALGYVTRRNPPGNQRKRLIHLTPAGRRLREVLVPLAEDVNAVAVHGVPMADVEVTRRTLLAMVQNLADDEARALAEGKRIPSTRERAGRSQG